MLKEVVAAASEMKEVKSEKAENFKEIKPESSMTAKEAKGFWDSIFGKGETKDYNISYEDRLKRVPLEGDRGSWDGKRGESLFRPNAESELGARAVEKLSEKGLEGIEYRNAAPDFSKCAEATVQIDNMTGNRFDYPDNEGNMQKGNFSQADIKCAEVWNRQGKDGRTDWTEKDVEKWRSAPEHRCAWHERCDTKTMDLVPFDIHRYFGHLGGVAECKARDAVNIGGGFDE